MSSSIPPALYAHEDPLLSRLRLNSSTGQLMNQPAASSSELRDVQVVGILFGAEVERERGHHPVEMYKAITELSRRNPHRFKCIYVSIDPSEEIMQESLHKKGWLSMVWNDGSNAGGNPAAIAQILNDEDFIMDPSEELLDEKLCFTPGKPIAPLEEISSSKKKQQKLYRRPYGRVGLSQKFDILSTPELAIYHVPSRTIITKRVKRTELRADHARETMDAWMQGERSPYDVDFSLRDIAMSMKWTLALAVIAAVILGLRYFGGSTFELAPILQNVFAPKELHDTSLSGQSTKFEL